MFRLSVLLASLALVVNVVLAVDDYLCKQPDFTCHDGGCIDIFWVCDGHQDCTDGSDEAVCDESCNADQFRCTNGRCIPDLWLCDGDGDCGDNSDEDERKCQTTTTVHACGLDEFSCGSSNSSTPTQCISNEWVCDGELDCPDGSDEQHPSCPDDSCSTNNGGCQHVCVPTKYPGNGNGHRVCTCNDGYKLVKGSDTSCEKEGPDDSCSTNNGGCQHVCVPTKYPGNGNGHRVCTCNDGYKLVNGSDTSCEKEDKCTIRGTCSQICVNDFPEDVESFRCECHQQYTLEDGRYCKARVSAGRPQLLLVDRNDIRRKYLDTGRYSVLMHSTKVAGAIAFDYDIRRDMIYWSPIQGGLSAVNLKTKKVSNPLSDVQTHFDGVAVDWVHGNLYVTDRDNAQVVVVRLDGRAISKVLVSSDLDEPRAVVVDPYQGWLYWTDWGDVPKIEKCGMNGKQRRAIITQNVVWPNGLTIDFVDQRLYWVDAKLRQICTTDLDGQDYHLVAHDVSRLGHPFSITVFEDFVYWSDWISDGVFKTSKFGTGNISTIVSGLSTPNDLKVYHPYRQPINIDHCGPDYGGCSHLCLPVPQNASDAMLIRQYECACPGDMVLLEDSRTCADSVDVTTPEAIKTTKTTLAPKTTKTTLAPKTTKTTLAPKTTKTPIGPNINGYFFTMSKTLREGEVSRFCLTAYSAIGNSRNVSMSLVNTEDPKIKVLIENTYEHGVEQCSNFTVPLASTYVLLLYNETDILHDSVDLTVQAHSQITLIQTDKPIYKPGQKVKFRILTIQSNQKPRTGTISFVYVRDPNGSRVKQFLNVDSKGIASLEFQLSKEVQLGRWQIAVFLNETEMDEEYEDGMVSFEVKEYVLPRFEVVITPPSYILATDAAVQGKVCAKFTYGKDVRGFLDLKVCGTERYGMGKPYGSCHHEVVKLSGCYNFTANASALLSASGSYSFYGWQLKIDASVTEAGTGNVVNATHKGPSLTRQQLNIELKDFTNGYFKPGLPFHGKVIVTKPDGQPAPGEKIFVSAFDYDTNVKMEANFTSDEAGVIDYALCGVTAENVTSLSLMAEAVDYVESDSSRSMLTPRTNSQIKQWFSPSFSYIQIHRTEQKQKCGQNMTVHVPFTTKVGVDTLLRYQVIARGKVVLSGSRQHTHQVDDASSPNVDTDICLISQNFPEPEVPDPDPMMPVDSWGSPPLPPMILENSDEGTSSPSSSSSSLEEVVVIAEGDEDDDGISFPPLPPDVPPPPVLPPLGPIVDPYGPSEPPFKEPIVRSEYIADTVSSFTLEIPISTVMAPKFTVVIHHVLGDGEVVADSMDFQVEPCFDNNVQMTFDRETVLPGEEVKLRVEAEPGSVCGLGIVDRSVNILGGSHQITMDTILEKIEALNIKPWSSDSYESEREYCERRVKQFLGDEHFWDISSRYADAKEAFKASGMMVLTNLKLETRPCQVSSPYVYDFVGGTMEGPWGVQARGGDGLGGRVPGPSVPLPAVALPIHTNNPASNKPVQLRSHFPETWLWDLQIIGENGTLVLPQEAPHTITSWVGNAMCMDADKGVGISALQRLTTFQPFFIHVKLPYAAVRGEGLPVMVTVHNHLDKCLHMKLSMDMGESFRLHNRFSNREPFCVCPDKSFTATYHATAQDIGSLPIVAKAEIVAGTCNSSVDVDLTYVGLSDAVKRQVFVKAEGVTQEYTHSLYMCAEEQDSSLEDVILPLPEGIVSESERADIKVIGDIMGPALTNLDNLVRLPTGCGEQNMVGFTPNIFVLKYLTNTGLLTEEIHDNAVKFMEIGYQRELNYRHRDGSYSAFGKNDERGSVWLTAFVVKSYAQATPYVYIDPVDIEKSVRFLKRSQSENGCFEETGKVFSSYMMGGLGKKKTTAALTSYVLIALLQAGINSSESVIVEGFKCIDNEFSHSRGRMDVYSLAISAYANTLLDPFSRSSIEIMKVLERKAKRDGSLKFWNRDGVHPPSTRSLYYSQAASAEVEMTSYALLAYLIYYGEGAIPHSHEIAMWLSHQRNPQGGFASTQDTVMGLNALSEFALMAYKDTPTNMTIRVTGNSINQTFLVSEKDNTKLLVQTAPIKVVPVRLRISAEGAGCALVQANVRYNKMPENIGSNKPGFHLKVMTRRYRHDINKCDRRTINIAVGSRGMKKHSKGMSLVIVRMVTSWTPIKDSLVKLESIFPVLGMKRYEYDEVENKVTFYFDEFTRRPREFAIDVEQDRDLDVSNPKAAQVSVINYYETDIAVVKSYGLKTICGTKLEIPILPPGIPFDPSIPFPVQRRVDNRFQQRRLPETRPGPAAPKAPKCPVCSESKSLPPDLDMKGIVCNASSVYKTIAGRRGAMVLKIRQDIRPDMKVALNKFANYTLPDGCECSMLNPPLSRVFIITSSKLKGKSLDLESDAMVTISTRKIEREIMALKKTCRRG